MYKQFALDLAEDSPGTTRHRNVLVVLCDFDADAYGPAWHPDPTSTPSYYDSLFFSDDPTDGLTSLREYYRDNSHGRLLISGRVTSGWLTMPHSYAYYVNGQSGLAFYAYPRSAQKLAEDAMAAAYVAAGGDLDFFDNDGPDGIPHSGDDDGYIDAVCVIHPGVGAEIVPTPSQSGAHIWSHEAGITIYSDCPSGESSPACLPGMPLGDVRGFLYFMESEFYQGPRDRAVGTYFHDFGHTIGLPSLYGVTSYGLGVYSLMALGSYLPIQAAQGALASHPANLDAWSRQFVGFETPAVPSASGSHAVAPADLGGTPLKVWTNGQPAYEYFLMESRSQSGSDAFLPGAGLLIYHVDDTKIDNLDSAAPRVVVVQADGRNDLGNPYGNPGDAGDFFPGSGGIRTWGESTSPSSRAFSGLDSQVRLSDIADAGSGTVSFHLTVSTTPALEVESYRIDDGENGYPDPNEQDSIVVSVRNVGVASHPVTYNLRTDDPSVTIVAGSSGSAAVTTGGTAQLDPPFVVATGTPPALPHPVEFVLEWNDGTASGSTSFATSIGMRAGLSEGFEAGAPGWTHQPLAPSLHDDWHVSSSRAWTGTASMKVGSGNPLGEGSNADQTYASLQDAVLVSPIFQLAAGSKLTFQSWIDAETNGGTGAWDGARVELSMNGGAWRPLGVMGGYGYLVEFNSLSMLRGQEAFSGSPQQWRTVTADLSGHEGSAQLRFRFSSDDYNAPVDASGNPTRYYEGWYIDDVAVSRDLAISVDLDPNVINLRNHAPWVTAYIEPLGFDPRDVDLSTLRLANVVQPESKFVTYGDHDQDGRPDLMVKFSRTALEPVLKPGRDTLVVAGSLLTGESFRGCDEVSVIDPPDFRPTASVAPNPLNPAGVLTLRMTSEGPVTLRLYDLHGRVVRTLLEGRMLSVGTHEVAIDGRGARGEELGSGVYFYRVETAEGSIRGRVVILK
ncbi:MAG: M6 family metalloprotease domain-containing protein [Hyphomicrobiales bacterium]